MTALAQEPLNPHDPAAMDVLRAALEVAELDARHLSVSALCSASLDVLGPVLQLQDGALVALGEDSPRVLATWSALGRTHPGAAAPDWATRTAAMDLADAPEDPGTWHAALGGPGARHVLLVTRDDPPIGTWADQRLLDTLTRTLQATLDRIAHATNLERAHLQLQHTVHVLPALLVRLDATGHVVHAGGQAWADLGLQATDLFGAAPTRPDLATPWQRYARVALEGRTITITLATGERRYEAQFVSLSDRTGAPDGAVVLGYDVTERERATWELSAVVALSTVLESPTDLGGAVTRVLAILAEVLDVTWLTVWRGDARGHLTPFAGWPAPGGPVQLAALPAAQLRAGYDVTLEAGSVADVDGAALLMPVWATPASGVAVLGVGGPSTPLVTPAQHAVLLAAARTLRAALRRDEELHELRWETFTDVLTGRPNRRQFDRDLGTLEVGDAVVLVDIDHFKAVNDTFGHAVGDAALREVAERLVQHLPAGQEVYRYGGEEFALLLRGVTPGDAWARMERLREAVARTPLTATGQGVTVSMGVSGLTGGTSVRTLHEADRALYDAKGAGRNRVCLW